MSCHLFTLSLVVCSWLVVLSFKLQTRDTTSRVSQCVRNDTAVEEKGRFCGAPCTKRKTCRSPERSCQCDGECGRSCVLIDLQCPILENFENGVVTMDDRQFGSKAFYSCFEGYELIGFHERHCQGDGTWSDGFSTCKLQVRCFPELLARFEGVLYEKAKKSFYLKGESVLFVCNSRYDLVPLDAYGQIFCTEDDWLVLQHSCQPKNCPPYPIPKYGYVPLEGRNRNHGDMLVLQCIDGYELRGTNHPLCDKGRWVLNGGIPFCQNVDFEDEEIVVEITNDEITTYPPTDGQPKIQTTPAPQPVDENIFTPFMNYTVSEGDVLVLSSGDLRITVNSNIKLSCGWILSRDKPSWSFIPAREPENYVQNWNAADHTLALHVLSVQEDDSGKYTCESPLATRSHHIIVHVTPNLSNQLFSDSRDDDDDSDSVENGADDYNQCEFRRPFNSIVWLSGQRLVGDNYIPDGATVHIQCREPGLFVLVGAANITCSGGHWIPHSQPECVRLLRNSETSPPPILVSEPHNVLPDGSIAVAPTTTVRLSCLWVLPPEPQDTWYHPTWYQSTPEGNLVLPAEINRWSSGEGLHYRYEILVDGNGHDDVVYTCLTPLETSHAVHLHFKTTCLLERANIPLYLEVKASDLKAIYLVGERIQFQRCKDRTKIMEIDHIICLSNGQWSNVLAHCY